MTNNLLPMFHIGQVFKQKTGKNFIIVEVLPKTVAIKFVDESDSFKILVWYEKEILRQMLKDGKVGIVKDSE